MESIMTWWKEAVIYQIYPRSFYDSNGDGVGDLKGIIQKLDYLNGKEDSLGIDAIWLSPVYPSPMFDFGYDISDYEKIDPVFGDLNIFKELLFEAHKRNIKIIMDLVVNHTSHLHPWFIESRSSLKSKKRNWYIWKYPIKEKSVKNKTPNEWMSVFGGSAWEFDELTGQYYYHAFYKEQPDLNWRNEEVKEAIYKMMRYWLDMGVDGFRLDVVNFYIKDDLFRNNPKNFFKGLRAYDRQYHIYDINRPETHDITREMRKILDSYKDKMSVGEVAQEAPGSAHLPASFYGEESDELHMAFNFSFLYSKWGPGHFAKIIKDWGTVLKSSDWPNYTLSNHDQRRHFSRYSKGRETHDRAKIAALMLLTLRGTPFLYYGEEIGMKSARIPKKRIQDPVGKTYWPFYAGRDNARTPMCWNHSEKAGFTTGEPWLPINNNHKIVNVEKELNDPESLLNFYKKLIKVRKERISLKLGYQEFANNNSEKTLAYYRYLNNERLLVLLNFTNKQDRFIIESSKVQSGKYRLAFSTHGKESIEVTNGIIEIVPYEGMIIVIQEN